MVDELIRSAYLCILI